MRKKFSYLVVAIATLGIVAGLAGRAEAIPITGGVAFGGSAAPNTGDWDTATAVDFGAGTNAVVTSATGAYSALVPFVTTATFTDFAFDPALAPSPVDPLWTITAGGFTYSFILQSVTENLTGNNDDLSLSGTGILRITGVGSPYDDTVGEWDFTGQQSGDVFSFSASNAAAAVPEPASMALLGLGLLGFGAASRRRKLARNQ